MEVDFDNNNNNNNNNDPIPFDKAIVSATASYYTGGKFNIIYIIIYININKN